MLNKLLKRCMPWMDKGRWYKIVLKGTGDNFVVDHDKSDSIFMQTSSNYVDDEKIILLSNTPVGFIDVKCVEGPDSPLFITASYYSNGSNVCITLYKGMFMTPYEGRELTFCVFGV